MSITIINNINTNISDVWYNNNDDGLLEIICPKCNASVLFIENRRNFCWACNTFFPSYTKSLNKKRMARVQYYND